MIIKWPGAQRGHVDTDYHYNLDLLPTLCDIFDIPPAIAMTASPMHRPLCPVKVVGARS